MQFAGFYQIQRKLSVTLNYLEQQRVPLNSLCLAGGVSCNKEFRFMMKLAAKRYGLKTMTAKPELCTDNGAMIAWMGWELKMAQQDVDIRRLKVDGHAKIPLGSYVKDLMKDTGRNKTRPSRKGVLTSGQAEQRHGEKFISDADTQARQLQAD